MAHLTRLPGVPLLVTLCISCGASPDPQNVTTPPPTTTQSAPETTEYNATFLRAVDGDTVAVLLEPDGVEARVRPPGIDAPERGDCGYRQATQYVAAQIPNGWAVSLVPEPGGDDKDRYGRLLRYVRYAPTNGGPIRDLSWVVVEAGWAVSYDRYPVSATPALEALEEQARTAGRGQWAPVAAGGCQ